jgi:hypothetical protein
VAWIFQVKTLLSTALGLAALLAFRQRPRLALVVFVLALLSKVSAASVLPALLVWLVCDTKAGGVARREWAWLGAWAAAFVLVAIPIWAAIDHTGVADARPYESVATGLRTIVSLAMRYGVMAASGIGVSAFQEPARTTDFADPWFISGVVMLLGLGVRAASRLRARDPEAVFWVLAAAAWVPVSQIVPFRYPLGDHYLYPILPGLIGGGLFALQSALPGLVGGLQDPAGALVLGRRGKAVAVVGVVVLFAMSGHAHARAGLWVSARSVSEDAAAQYPDGREAWRIRLYDAARRGDAAAAAAALDRLRALGGNDFGEYLSNPVYGHVRDAPVFRAVVEAMARFWIERAEQVETPTQLELSTFANAFYVTGDLDRSIVFLERASLMQGPGTERLLATLDARRLEQRLRDRSVSRPVRRQAP